MLKPGDKVVFREDRGFSDLKVYTVKSEFFDGLLMQQFVKFTDGTSAAAINVRKLGTIK